MAADCPAAGWQQAPNRPTAAARLLEHYDEAHRDTARGAVRVVDAPAAPAGGTAPGVERGRVLGDPALSVVVEPGRLVNPGGGVLTIERPAHVGQLLDVITEAVVAVFITAAALEWMGLPAKLHGQSQPPARSFFVDDAITAGWVVEPGGLSWQLRARRSSTSRAVSVVLLPYDDAGYCAPWSTMGGEELVAGLAAFRAAVGVPFAASIGQTGERILLATHPRERGGARLDAAPVMPPAIDEVAEIATTWRRPIDEQETGGWVHWYDANANYLGAYQTAELGRGEPAQVRGAELARVLGERYLPPGLWRCRLPRELDDVLPGPWSAEAGWHTSPTIARARELGVPVEQLVGDGWVWPLRSRFCQPFGELMRDARARLIAADDAPGAAPALRAVTMIYQRLHGRFGAGFRVGTGSAWARPDWMHTLRATARVNLDRRLRRCAVPPFAVDVDAAYFIADTPDPEAWAARVGLPLGPRAKLGAFRVAGSVELTPAIRATLDDAGSAAATREILRGAAASEPADGRGQDDDDNREEVPGVDDVDDEGLAELAEALRGGTP